MANKQIVDYTSGTFAPTAEVLQQPAAGGIYKKVNLAQLLGFKMSLFACTQSGTNPISLTAIYDTIGGWSSNYSSPGRYTIDNAAILLAGKTFVFSEQGTSPAGFATLAANRETDDSIRIEIDEADGAGGWSAANNAIGGTFYIAVILAE